MQKSSKFKIAWCLVSGAALLVPCATAMAALDEFSPYAYARVRYDSNLFRVANTQEIIDLTGDDKKDDTITYLGAGLKSDWKLSRQHLLLDADVAQVLYDHFDDLDHTRARAKADWDWQLGNLWSGHLGYSFRTRLASFNQDNTPEKDMRTSHTGYFNGAYRLTPDWTLIASTAYNDTSYEERDRFDRVSTTGQFESQYRNTLNTRVGIRARYTDYDLKNEQIVSGVPIDNDYEETEVSGVFYWEGSAKSSLEARLGYTMLRYNELDDRDFNGFSGRLSYYWVVTGKTRLDLTVWHETSSLNDEISTYVLTQGVRLKPVWSATSKVSVEGELSYSNDNYKGEEDIREALGLEKRDEDWWTYGIAAKWTPRKLLSVRLGYRVEKRDSTIDEREFDDSQIDAEVRLRFYP